MSHNMTPAPASEVPDGPQLLLRGLSLLTNINNYGPPSTGDELDALRALACINAAQVMAFGLMAANDGEEMGEVWAELLAQTSSGRAATERREIRYQSLLRELADTRNSLEELRRQVFELRMRDQRPIDLLPTDLLPPEDADTPGGGPQGGDTQGGIPGDRDQEA